MSRQRTIRTIMLQGAVAANSEAYIFSRKIGVPFSVRAIYVSWPAGSNRLVAAYPYVVTDNSPPASGKPEGTNLLDALSTTPYLVGSGDYRYIRHHYKVETANTYILLYLVNGDGVNHVVDAYVEIEEKPDAEI